MVQYLSLQILFSCIHMKKNHSVSKQVKSHTFTVDLSDLWFIMDISQSFKELSSRVKGGHCIPSSHPKPIAASLSVLVP